MSDAPILTKHNVVSHLTELRNRMLIGLAVWIGASIACYLVVEHVLYWLTLPLQEAFANPQDKRLIFTSLPEAFLTYLSLAFFSGFLVAFPVLAFQLYRFVAPGLYRHERHVVLPFVIAAPLLFYLGAALAYFYIFPAAWKFFVSFELSGQGGALPVELEAKLGEYLNLIMSIICAFGLAFQLPIILLLMIRAGMIRTATLRSGRRYAIVILLIIAAFLTPPDVLSQLGLFSALYALYEVAIMMGRYYEPPA